jgi:hypothetical protein
MFLVCFFLSAEGTKILTRHFHLSPPGRGVSCDMDGAFVGAAPLLIRLRKNGLDEWQPRDCGQISEQLTTYYGLPIDISSKSGGLKAIAKALNDGDIVRAQIATILLSIPDPPDLSKDACSQNDLIKLIGDLSWSGMLKWDSGAHPRWPAGSGDSKGGQFAPKGVGDAYDTSPPNAAGPVVAHDHASDETDTIGRDPRIQLADAGMSDASDDPVREAVARADAVAARHTAAQASSRNKHQPHPAAGGGNSWVTRAQKLWAAIVAAFGSPQNTTHEAEDAHELASKVLGSHLKKMRGVRAIYYHMRLSTITKGQIKCTKLPDVTVEMEDNTIRPYEILSPNQTALSVAAKYKGVNPIAGSKFRLAEPEIMTNEEVMALPEAAPILAEQAEAEAAIMAQEEEAAEAALGEP